MQFRKHLRQLVKWLLVAIVCLLLGRSISAIIFFPDIREVASLQKW
jgi:hypothetical protein